MKQKKDIYINKKIKNKKGSSEIVNLKMMKKTRTMTRQMMILNKHKNKKKEDDDDRWSCMYGMCEAFLDLKPATKHLGETYAKKKKKQSINQSIENKSRSTI